MNICIPDQSAKTGRAKYVPDHRRRSVPYTAVAVLLAFIALGMCAPGAHAQTTTGTTPGTVGYPNNAVSTTWINSTAGGYPVIYANTLPGINLNSNLWTGGGTDDRATLQAALNNLAGSGGGTLVLPACALVSGSLAMSSNERIVGMNEGTCGLFLSGSSNTPVITNIHRSYIVGSDSNIVVENLTVNGNGQYPQNQENQAHNDANGNFVNGIEFNGVNNVTVSDAQSIDSRCYAFCFTSCNEVTAAYLTAYWHFPDHNNDTVHLDAPYSDVYIHDIWGNGLDDEIALNGDEDYGFGEEPYSVIDTGSANSNHIRVWNITAAYSVSAVRLISLVGRADDIVICNVNGNIRNYGILIDTAGRSGFPGNFGNITIKDVNLAYAYIFNEPGLPYQNMIGIVDKVDNLKLLDFTVDNYSSAYYLGWYGPWMYIGPNAQVGSLTTNGIWQDKSFTSMSASSGRIMLNGGSVTNFTIGPLQWTKPTGSATGGILLSVESGTLGTLTLNDVSTNNGLAIVDQTGGSIGAIYEVGLSDLAAAGPSLDLTSAATQTVVESPYTLWKNEMFTTAEIANPSISGDSACPAGDGIPNLMKYALDMNPWSYQRCDLPAPSVVTTGSGNYPALTFNKAIPATDITFTVQVSSDLQNWFSGTSYTSTPTVTNNSDGYSQKVTVQSSTPLISAHPPQFMRLNVTGP